MKPEDLLLDLKIMTKEHPEGIPMFQFKSIMSRKYKFSWKSWSWNMRYLVDKRRIEVFGPDQRIRPLTNDIERNINQEISITNDLIKDVLSECSPCTPNEAYKYCVQKFGYCTPESFTRLMRKMAQLGIINRDDNGYYSIGKPKQKPIFAYAEE